MSNFDNELEVRVAALETISYKTNGHTQPLVSLTEHNKLVDTVKEIQAQTSLISNRMQIDKTTSKQFATQAELKKMAQVIVESLAKSTGRTESELEQRIDSRIRATLAEISEQVTATKSIAAKNVTEAADLLRARASFFSN